MIEPKVEGIEITKKATLNKVTIFITMAGVVEKEIPIRMPKADKEEYVRALEAESEE